MSLINRIKKSSVNKLELTYNGEKIQVDLNKELDFNHDNVNDKLVNQPKIYAFLKELHAKLVKKSKVEWAKLEKIYNDHVIHFYTSENSSFVKENNKKPSQEIAKMLAKREKDYQKQLSKCHKVDEQRDEIQGAIDSFEQRSSLIQTLSANARRERG